MLGLDAGHPGAVVELAARCALQADDGDGGEEPEAQHPERVPGAAAAEAEQECAHGILLGSGPQAVRDSRHLQEGAEQAPRSALKVLEFSRAAPPRRRRRLLEAGREGSRGRAPRRRSARARSLVIVQERRNSGAGVGAQTLGPPEQTCRPFGLAVFGGDRTRAPTSQAAAATGRSCVGSMRFLNRRECPGPEELQRFGGRCRRVAVAAVEAVEDSHAREREEHHRRVAAAGGPPRARVGTSPRRERARLRGGAPSPASEQRSGEAPEPARLVRRDRRRPTPGPRRRSHRRARRTRRPRRASSRA